MAKITSFCVYLRATNLDYTNKQKKGNIILSSSIIYIYIYAIILYIIADKICIRYIADKPFYLSKYIHIYSKSTWFLTKTVEIIVLLVYIMYLWFQTHLIWMFSCQRLNVKVKSKGYIPIYINIYKRYNCKNIVYFVPLVRQVLIIQGLKWSYNWLDLVGWDSPCVVPPGRAQGVGLSQLNTHRPGNFFLTAELAVFISFCLWRRHKNSERLVISFLSLNFYWDGPGCLVRLN